jgi:hypothetical protein
MWQRKVHGCGANTRNAANLRTVMAHVPEHGPEHVPDHGPEHGPKQLRTLPSFGIIPDQSSSPLMP